MFIHQVEDIIEKYNLMSLNLNNNIVDSYEDINNQFLHHQSKFVSNLLNKPPRDIKLNLNKTPKVSVSY